MVVQRENNYTSWTTRLAALGLTISNPEHTLICTLEVCRHALQVHDKRVSRQAPNTQFERKGLDKYIASLDLSGPRQLPPRADGSDPDPHLAKQVGFDCRICRDKSASLKLIDQHIRWMVPNIHERSRTSIGLETRFICRAGVRRVPESTGTFMVTLRRNPFMTHARRKPRFDHRPI